MWSLLCRWSRCTRRKSFTGEREVPPLAEPPLVCWTTDCIPHGSVQGRLPQLFNRQLLRVLLVWSPAWRHFSFYYVTKLRYGGSNTTWHQGCSPQKNLKCHQFGAVSHRSDHVAKHTEPCEALLWARGSGGTKKKKLLWRWFQAKSVPVKAPLKAGVQRVTAKILEREGEFTDSVFTCQKKWGRK